MEERYAAILLIGPTGSGKTPLGDRLEQDGLWSRRCCHFDFGAALRAIGEGGRRPALLTDEDVAVIVSSLQTGALLEDHRFHIARNILLSFAEERRISGSDLLVLNGMPRHAGQAEKVDAFLAIARVVHLACEPETVLGRIERDTGGDRAGRVDDSLGEVRRKLEIFRERTAPLLDHYRQEGVRIDEFNVQVDTAAEEIHQWLNARQ